MNDAPDVKIPPAGDEVAESALEVVPEPPAAEPGPQGTAASPAATAASDAEPASPPLSHEDVLAAIRERDELRAQIVRRRADFENLKRRAEREQRQARADGIADLVGALIPSLDNLDRALKAEGDAKAFREGIELIHRGLQAALESQGVRAEDPTGSAFDPNEHQAVAHDPHPEADDGTVVEALGKAYFLKDRLIRPAFVRVARRDSTAPQEPPEAIP
jgi:molecular chaperone GrpE